MSYAAFEAAPLPLPDEEEDRDADANSEAGNATAARAAAAEAGLESAAEREARARRCAQGTPFAFDPRWSALVEGCESAAPVWAVDSPPCSCAGDSSAIWILSKMGTPGDRVAA